MKIRIVYLIACMMLVASMPSALAVTSYGGSNVEVPVLSPGLAEGDSSVLNDWTGVLDFGSYTAGPAYIDADPWSNTYAKYAHAWVFVGAYGATNGAYAEWSGEKYASATDVVDGGAAQGTYVIQAQVSGQAQATVTNDLTDAPAANVYAESLIDAFAGETTGPRQLWGNAQITSTVYHDGTGTADTGTTAFGTIGTTQPSAQAAFSAQRSVNYGGQVLPAARIVGTATGVTSFDPTNTLNGHIYGFSTINTQAWTDAADNGFQSYSASEIRTDTHAERTAAGTSTVSGYASGDAYSQAWSPASSWFTAKTHGTENAYSEVSGKTTSTSVARRANDATFGLSSGLVRSQIFAAAGDDTDVFGNALTDGRDSIASTLTDAFVYRTANNANRVSAETFIEDGNAASFSDRASNSRVSTELTGVQQSSGGHAIAPTTTNMFAAQGSIAGVVARSTFDPTQSLGDGVVAVTLGDVNGFVNPFTHSGLLTSGPSWTMNRWDDAGSYVAADSQSAVATTSVGTYSITADPVSVNEWVAGNDPNYNMYYDTNPITVHTSKPVGGLIIPLDNPIQNGRNGLADYYGWSGAVFGDQ
jgi:hypothetical protein